MSTRPKSWLVLMESCYKAFETNIHNTILKFPESAFHDFSLAPHKNFCISAK